MTAAANAQTIERFYEAFARLDAPAMAACYASDAAFDDEAFSLRGRRQVGGMWRMLCDATRAKGADVWRLTWRERTLDNDVPLPFRGLPIELISAGLMAVAFLGFTGLIKT